MAVRSGQIAGLDASERDALRLILIGDQLAGGKPRQIHRLEVLPGGSRLEGDQPVGPKTCATGGIASLRTILGCRWSRHEDFAADSSRTVVDGATSTGTESTTTLVTVSMTATDDVPCTVT